MSLIIGISGAARSGKDTLCRALIREFKKVNKEAIRKSIAGDLIKKDLNILIKPKLNIDCLTEDSKNKELLRPLMIEYGKLMRITTNGKYFTNKFSIEKNKINIIPDIRYAEYEKDELYWLKNQMKGFLIFIKRKGIKDANETEKFNNKIIKKKSDYYLEWDSLNEESLKDLCIINNYAKDIIKKFTIYLEDNQKLLRKL